MKVKSEIASATGFTRDYSRRVGAARLGSRHSHTEKRFSRLGDHESEYGDRYDPWGLGAGAFVAKKNRHTTPPLHRSMLRCLRRKHWVAIRVIFAELCVVV